MILNHQGFHIVDGSTKYYLFILSLIAQLPIQDVSGDDMTHLSATQTQLCVFLCKLWACNEHEETYYVYYQCLLHSQSVHNRTQNWCWGIIHLFFKKMDQAKDKQEEKKTYNTSIMKTHC